MDKGSRVAGETLYYLSLDWYDSSTFYEQDHLHPLETFENSHPIGVSPEAWTQWRMVRNRLPNLWLLAGRPNASKSDMSLVAYFEDKTEDQQKQFLREAMIPEGASLELRDFGEFYERRKALMASRLRKLLK